MDDLRGQTLLWYVRLSLVLSYYQGGDYEIAEGILETLERKFDREGVNG